MKTGDAMRTAMFALWLAAAALPAGVSTAAEQLKIVDASPGKPPSDAVVLFDGGSTAAFLNVKGTPCQWPVVKGAMVVEYGSSFSKLHFRRRPIHVEFAVPDDGKKGGGAGNSGVYLFGMYEMQILNSYENPIAPKEAVALYGISPPLVNAAKAGRMAGLRHFVHRPRAATSAARWSNRARSRRARTACWCSTRPISPRASPAGIPCVYKKTPYTDKILASILKTDCGPLFLQDHGSPVRFRNVWVRPLDDKAHVFKDPG